jgi:hypothetical protein
MVNNYLSDSAFSVVRCNDLSSKPTVGVEVPQGNLLWPILFIIYVSGMPLILKEHNMAMFES